MCRFLCKLLIILRPCRKLKTQLEIFARRRKIWNLIEIMVSYFRRYIRWRSQRKLKYIFVASGEKPIVSLCGFRMYKPRVRNSRYWREMLLSPIHCCDVTKPPYLLSGELCTSPLRSNRLCVYTVCCRRGGQCFSVLRTRHTDVVGDTSGRSYVTEQGHNVPLLRTRDINRQNLMKILGAVFEKIEM